MTAIDHIITLSTRTLSGRKYGSQRNAARHSVSMMPNHQPEPMKNVPVQITASRNDSFSMSGEF